MKRKNPEHHKDSEQVMHASINRTAHPKRKQLNQQIEQIRPGWLAG